MDASHFDSFVDALIDALTPASPPPDDQGDRRLCHLLECPRPVVDDEALLAVLAAAVTAGNLLAFVVASAVAAAERAGIPARRHLRTGTDLLTLLGMAPGAAVRAVRVGRSADLLPALTTAQRLGGVGIEFADAVGKGVTHINARTKLSEDDRASVVTKLMIQTTPAEVVKKARAIGIDRAAALPPAERAVPVAEDADLNTMTLVLGEEGRYEATLNLDVGTGEGLCAALDPLCRPVPLPDGSPDPRPIEKRRGDAVAQILRTYLSQSTRPMSGGALPHVTLIRPASAAAAVGGEEVVDRLGFGGPVSAATADLIACDSTLTSVIVDCSGVPLDVGRAERLFTPAIRKALGVRDGGCAHPGCGRPVSWCDAHHIQPWSEGGQTSLDNGVLLCRLHHSLIHHGGWTVYLGRDRHPWFIPPHDPSGPEPEHLRSHNRRTMTELPTAA
ncbi:HNH endonuclease signature motif containing protein [Mycolicibacterium bacteremicum]|uniref:HNH endonuclease n=1 Tax=Mycolicibacterium bacteremicum TaxID=564198 RepID=A0A1W9YZW4_MYCBA|nr:HNH endonuclease signature motif containing protein [Mycolicibacterium bacteremicum]ORA05499.1 HNH endonuclease [Mycolicibacterium bacteremicum]